MLEIIKTKEGWDVCIPVGHGGRLNNTIASFVSYADAILFISAPGLLEACKSILATWDRHNVPLDSYFCRDRQMIEQAIKKAEGEK